MRINVRQSWPELHCRNSSDSEIPIFSGAARRANSASYGQVSRSVNWAEDGLPIQLWHACQSPRDSQASASVSSQRWSDILLVPRYPQLFKTASCSPHGPG